MKLVFSDIEIEGFKCFVKPIRFRLGEYEPGLHYMRGQNTAEPRLGPNGAGKSTLWDAVSWCLYGRTPKGSRNPDIKPWYGNKHTKVAQHLKIGNKSHVIERTANPNALRLDDRPVGQEQIDQLVGLPFDTFTHTLLLGQGQPLFFDLQPRTKMDLFSDVLDLERWERRSKLASDRVRQLEQQEAVLEGELSGIETNIANLQKMIKDVKASSAEWSIAHGDRMRTAHDELEEVKRGIATLQPKCDDLSTKLDWTLAEVKLINADLANLHREQPPTLALDLSRKRLVKELNAPAGVCPTCGGEIDIKSEAKHRSKIKATIKEIDANLKRAVRIQKEIDALSDSLTVYQADADSLATELDTMTPQLYSLKAKANELRKLLDEKQDEANPYHDQLQNLRRNLSKAQGDLKLTKTDLAKAQRRQTRNKFWIAGFKDVRLFVIDEVLQELQLTTNALLDEVGLVGWSVEYEVERETKSGTTQRGLNVMITSPAVKDRVRWESWSGGEGQRLRIIGALALSEVLLNYAGVQASLEVLDEPAHFMAADGVRDLTDYLAERARALGKTIFYIDHISIESSRFASVTTIIKDKEGAHIE